MKAFGNSMLPIIKSGSTLTFEKREFYEIGDIVFCKVKGRFIDAHKITKEDPNKGYMIYPSIGNQSIEIPTKKPLPGLMSNILFFFDFLYKLFHEDQ